MNIFAWLDTGIMVFYGIFIMFLNIKNWGMKGKPIRCKISEIFYGIAFILDGFIILNLFNDQGLSPATLENIYFIIFLVFASVLIWLWVGNVAYTAVRTKKHPEILNKDAKFDRDFDSYFNKLEKEYENEGSGKSKDIMKDLSRKALHLVIMFVLIGAHEFSYSIAPLLATYGLTPLAFRNLLYITVSMLFTFMFTTEDAVRVYKFRLLPDWALKWIGKSLEIKTEKYSYISSIPFVLTLILFINAPFSLVIAISMVACISDAAASVVGKSFGKRKLTNFGRYPHKSWEGLVAGATSAFLGVFLAFQVMYPTPGITMAWAIIFGLEAALAFVYVDAFSKYIVDNVLNLLLPGLLIGLTIILFLQ
jgi:dolichol kinase